MFRRFVLRRGVSAPRLRNTPPSPYPTAAQRSQGYAGSAIGIHGPARNFTWAGWLNTTVDWTQGCIAVRSDETIESIAAWVKAKRVRTVRLAPGRQSGQANKRDP